MCTCVRVIVTYNDMYINAVQALVDKALVVSSFEDLAALLQSLIATTEPAKVRTISLLTSCA